MPEAGSAAASAIDRAVDSTPTVARAAASVGAVPAAAAEPGTGVFPGPAGRPALLVVVLMIDDLPDGWVRRRAQMLAESGPGQQKTPRAGGTEGWRVGRVGPAR
jgi:hypothetical protein